MAVRPCDITDFSAISFHELLDLLRNTAIKIKQLQDPAKTSEELPLTFVGWHNPDVLAAYKSIMGSLGWQVRVHASRESILVMVAPKPPVYPTPISEG